MSEMLLRSDAEGLVTLTLNRPDKHNALDTALFSELAAVCDELAGKGDAIGCLVIKANGPSFCAGADLKANGASPPPTFKPGVLERLAALPQMVVVQVHATCVTGGLELALAADLIAAGRSARFADTHGRWGLVGGWGMTQRLPRRIGVPQAKLMMTTGRFVNAAEAYRIGLVDILADDDQLDTTVSALVRDILLNSRHTNRAAKRLLIETEGMRLAEGLAHEHYRYPGIAPDFHERVASFKKEG